MIEQNYALRSKLQLIKHAQELKNVSKACKNFGVSRQHFYELQLLFNTYGVEGLRKKSQKIPRPKRRVPIEIEQAILDFSINSPSYGKDRVAKELGHLGVKVSATGVRSVWKRNGLLTVATRLKKMTEMTISGQKILTEKQIAEIKKLRTDDHTNNTVETNYPGALVGQDTYYVGTIKGIGRIYQQTAIDTCTNLGFAKVFNKQNSESASDILSSKILPFFDKFGLGVERVLTDNGAEFCGDKEKNSFGLFLNQNGIKHTRTKFCTPSTNGAVEKLNQTIQNEFYQVALRKKNYRSLYALQRDLDLFMDHYNHDRSNTGKRCRGEVPYKTFSDYREIYQTFNYKFEELAS